MSYPQNQPPQNWGQQPQQGGNLPPGGYAPAPPKKKKWPWVVGGIVLLGIVIGSTGNSGDSSTNTASTATSTAAQAPVAAAPAVTAVEQVPAAGAEAPAPPAAAPTTGAAVGTDEGWRLDSISYSQSSYGSDFEGTARITNTNSAELTAIFKVTLLNGANVVATLDGSTANVGPGETVSVDLFSSDTYQDGDFIADLQVGASF